MTESEIDSILVKRIDEIERRIHEACDRGDRDRSEVTLVAVTKTVGVEICRRLIAQWIFNFGENRPQSLWAKADAMADIRVIWHIIGHLQRNKVERSLSYHPVLIHSVDSMRLLEAIDAAAAKLGIIQSVLLEVNASREAAKNGFILEGVAAVGKRIAGLQSIQVRGLMAMAAIAGSPEDSRSTFREVRQLRDRLQEEWQLDMPELSMGMSGDFEVAIEEGATLIRVGTMMFEGLDQLRGEE